MDKDEARRLVKAHWPLFEKVITAGKDYTDIIKSVVAWLHTIALLLRCILVCGVWLGLSYVDPTASVVFLLVVSLVQTKTLIDTRFNGLDTIIASAVEEERRLHKCTSSSEEVQNEEENTSSS